MPFRFDASPALKQRILRRYGYECAACSNVGELTSDVAHLFEDATERRPKSDRLIVLCSNCNQAEERSKSRSKPSLLDLFSPDDVFVRAKGWYRRGNYRRAYQGQHLFEEQGYHSRAVGSLVEAILALRPIRWGDFLTATLFEIERLCYSHNVGPVQRWLCLDRLALVLYDYRLWKESGDVQAASVLLRATLHDDQRHPDDQKFDYANSFRRETLEVRWMRFKEAFYTFKLSYPLSYFPISILKLLRP